MSVAMNCDNSNLAKSDFIVVILSETTEVQQALRESEIETMTVQEIRPIRVQPARVLSKIYSRLGLNPKLGLSGHPDTAVGVLGTSKVYEIKGSTFLFTPQFLDQQDFYMSLDVDMLIDIMMTELQYLSTHWTMCGRPLITLPVTTNSIDEFGKVHSHLISIIKKISGGYINGVRVVMGNLQTMLSTSCYTELNFLEPEICQVDDIDEYLKALLAPSAPRPKKLESASSQSDVFEGDRRRDSLVGKFQDPNREEGVMFHFTDLSSLPDLKLVKHGHTVLGKLIEQSSSNLDQSAQETNDSEFVSRDVDSLLEQLVDFQTSIEERADILQYLFLHKGPNWDTQIGGESGTPVLELVEELYERAGREGNWLVVRQLTGLLRKRVIGLSKSVTDLLVRQKQITVGLPPEPREKTITRPLPSEELYNLIMDAFGEDTDIAVLTQEIIIYLAMFIRSSSGLFSDLLRLRVGLIIQVMASELARHLKCSGEEASMQLMSLSPYEMKRLIRNILSGKEFGITKVRTSASVADITLKPEISSKADRTKFIIIQENLRKRDLTKPPTRNLESKKEILHDVSRSWPSPKPDSVSEELSVEKRGQWLRRRRIDGALNRVPANFYSRVWKLLEKCYGMMIGVHHIPGYVTKEMTAGELKFALLVENVLNHIPQPEYRQLIVETMVILSLISDAQGIPFLSDNIRVDQVLMKASDIFYSDLEKRGCPSSMLTRDASSGICLEFYDRAPSGSFGTMSYLSKAVASTYLSAFPKYVQECFIS